MSNIKIEGVRELLETLSNTEKEMKHAARRANLKGAEVVAQELAKQTPYDLKSDGKHAKDNIEISNNRIDKNTGEYYVATGFNKKVSWRIHFPEFGTIKQSPNAFMLRTQKVTSSKVNKVMIDEVLKILK